MHPTTPRPPTAALPPARTGSPPTRFVELALRNRTRTAPTAPPARTAAPLLTHHQIAELAAPFARRGHALDLAASDRLQRQLVFRSVQHPPSPTPVTGASVSAGGHTLLETLRLDSPRPGYFRLTRTLCDDLGMQATLQADGARPGDLLAAVQAVPPQRHFHDGPGYRMAGSGCVAVVGSADAAFQLTHAVVRTDALTLNLSVPSSASAAATSAAVDLQLRRERDTLPADMLAVLGWDWSMLQARPQGWQGSVRLRGAPGTRGDDAEHKLRVAAAHLARTLADPPPRFHQRMQVARMGVLARHAIPLLVCALLAFGALFADVLREARASPLTLVLMCLPPALLLLFMLRSERPRLAWPAWPRPLAAHAWGVAR